MKTVLVCGTSTRAIAESAARAGFVVTAVDGFADRDQHPAVTAVSAARTVGRRLTAAALARVARPVAADAVVYTSPFENHPTSVAALVGGRSLWGNPPEVLRRVRNPLLVAETLRTHGLAVPAVRRSNDSDDPNDSNDSNDSRWLVKPLRSGGGRDVRSWDGERIGRGAYLQERIDGVPASIVFVAAGGHVVPLAISRQLVGDERFGASGYQYCGSIVAPIDDAQFAGGGTLAAAATRVAAIVAAEFDLVGVNGIDFIAAGKAAVPIEINPRWCSSMELVERLHDIPVFDAHAAACARGELPSSGGFATWDPASPTGEREGALGKAIVYARTDVMVGNTDAWLEDPAIRDVPRTGERIAAGRPICTVFARAADGAACYAALVQRSWALYAMLDSACQPSGAGQRA